jgi:hypothetical protein
MALSPRRSFILFLAVLALGFHAEAGSPQSQTLQRKAAKLKVKPLKKITLHNLRACLLSVGNYTSAGSIRASSGAFKQSELRHTARRETLGGENSVRGLFGAYRFNSKTKFKHLVPNSVSALPSDSLAGAVWVKNQEGEELEFFVLEQDGASATKALSVNYLDLRNNNAAGDLVIQLSTRAYFAGPSYLEFDAFYGNDPEYDSLKGTERTLAHGAHKQLDPIREVALRQMLVSETNRLLDRVAQDLRLSDSGAGTETMKQSASSALKIAHICEMGGSKVLGETKPAANRLHNLSTEILRDLQMNSRI